MAAPMRRSTLNYLVSNCGIGPRVCKLPLVAAHRSHIHHVAKQSGTFKSVYFGCNKQSTCSAIFNLRKLYSHSHSNALLLARSKQQVYFFARYFSKHAKTAAEKHSERTTMIYVAAIGVFMIGMSYAGVPLYRMFCQQTGLGGQAVKGHDVSKVENMTPVKERKIRVRFNADTASSMQWNFKPQQSEITVLPGETALAFYTAKNPTDKPIIGISTYNVVPFDAGQYFNKIQCFCFEEQWLNPREQVDMPVFFYIDPEFADDPKLELVDTITLSYTFFEAKEGMNLPLPGYMQAQ